MISPDQFLKFAEEELGMKFVDATDGKSLRCCKKCRYYSDSVCCNGNSDHCADFVSKDNHCSYFELAKIKGELV